jgi:hypothetical protein
MNRRLVLPVLAASLCLATTTALAQTLLTYTLTGGTISGSINGTPFANASITITGTADAATLISGSLDLAPDPPSNYTFLPFTPTATITDGSTTYSMTIQNEVGRTWGGLAWDASSLPGPYVFGIIWLDNPAAFTTGDGFQLLLPPTGSFPSPIGPTSLLGVFALSTMPQGYPTSLGPLVLTSYTDNSATLNISQVPESSTWIPAGLVLSLGVFTLVRRQQHNRPQA